MMVTKKPVLCNGDCFHCIYPDCIVDETPSEAAARRKREKRHRYYVAHREKELAYQREHRHKKKEAANAL